MKLRDRTAVVTGSGSGFGEGIAELFAAEGARVVVCDVNEEGGRRVVGKIEAAGGVAFFQHADVSKDADVAALTTTAIERFGRLDIWVNNAGITHRAAPVETIDEATFDRIYAVNVKALYLSARHVVPLFRKAGKGVFLNIASTAGVRPRPIWSGTTARRARSSPSPRRWRWNWRRSRSASTPSTRWPAKRRSWPSSWAARTRPRMRAKFVATIPMGRLSRPSDIANAALFLVSDNSAFVTGVCMEVDGGRCI